jgi:hypothetical protein
MDPGRFRSGRWLLLAEGLLVSAFGIAGLVSAALHPHAGATGAPVLGLATTPAHSAMLLACGVVGVAAIGYRRAAITVTALSAVAYLMLLFVSSVATSRAKPTPLGFHAADIVLHGVLAVVNLGLLMWLIPDELGDEAWGPRRRRRRDRRQLSASETVTEPAARSLSAASATKPGPPPAAAPAREAGAHASPPERAEVAEPTRQRESTTPPLSSRPAHRTVLEQPSSHETGESPSNTQPKHVATQTADAVLSHVFVPVAVAVVVTVVGTVIWMRRRRR